MFVTCPANLSLEGDLEPADLTSMEHSSSYTCHPGVDRPGGHATPSACFTTPMATGHVTRLGDESNSRRGTGVRRRPRAASALTLQRNFSLCSPGTRKRGRSSKASPVPDDKGGDTEAGEGVTRSAARPRSAPVCASVRLGLRPTRMRPRSPSSGDSPSPGRKKRRAGQNKQTRLSSPTPQPPEGLLAKDEALLQTRVPRRSRSTEPLWRDLRKCETTSVQKGQNVSGLDMGLDEQAPGPGEVSDMGTNAEDLQHERGMVIPGELGVGTDEHKGRNEWQVEGNNIEEARHVSEGVCIPVQAADESWQPLQSSTASALKEQPRRSNKAPVAITVPQLQAPAADTGDFGSKDFAAAGPSKAEPLPPRQQPGSTRGPCGSEQGQPSTSDKGSHQRVSITVCSPRAGAKENSQGCANIQPSGAPAVANRKGEGLSAVPHAGGAGRSRQGFLSLTAGTNLINLSIAALAVVFYLCLFCSSPTPNPPVAPDQTVV